MDQHLSKIQFTEPSVHRNSQAQLDFHDDRVSSNSINQKSKDCGCKGIRTCFLCQGLTSQNFDIQRQLQTDDSVIVYNFCIQCQSTWSHNPTLSTAKGNESDGSTGVRTKCEVTLCEHPSQCCSDFEGVLVIENFVTEVEETCLVDAIYQTDFALSQSGRRKQDYGPKVNFKKKRLKFANFTGLPSYSKYLYGRMKQHPQLSDFEPVELCNLEYCCKRGAHIDPHFDDAWLWGERLVTLNLLSDSTLTFTLESAEVKVPLPRRSLIIVQGPARHLWRHEIRREHVSDRRIAMTFRELSAEFKPGGSRQEDGSKLEGLSLSFQGCAIGCS